MRVRALVVLVAAICVAASMSEAKPRIGIKGGMGLSSISGKATLDWNYNLGYVAGLSMQFNPQGQVGLMVEVLATEHGAKRAQSVPWSNLALSLHLPTLEVPVLGMFRLDRQSVIRPYIVGGPTFAIGLNPELRYQVMYMDDYYRPDGYEGEMELHSTHEFDIGLTFGIGAEVPLTRGLFTVEARYVHGTSGYDFERYQGIKDETISFTFGYYFGSSN
ncbi:MAG: PorT family protein [candidate division Zixibacteria bacterium]|nr:PorT family protein [candidate division Zixibacteria bacterium]